jgi:hypothetical protein
MSDEPKEPDPSVIKLPTANEQENSLIRSTLDFRREKLDAMHARMERGEFSEEEMTLVKNEAARIALGYRRMPLDSLPYDIQPAARKAIEEIWGSQWSS